MNEVATSLSDSVLYDLGCQSGKFCEPCMPYQLTKVNGTGTVLSG